MDEIKVDIMDIGNTVVCDFCNDDYTDSTSQGGCLIGSYAVCPKCTKDIKDLGDIDQFCPPDTEFRKWVLDLRAGDNTIKIYSK